MVVAIHGIGNPGHRKSGVEIRRQFVFSGKNDELTPDFRQAGYRKGPLANDLRQPATSIAHHLPTDTCNTYPDLAAVVAAWTELPEGIRASILAMVKFGLGAGSA